MNITRWLEQNIGIRMDNMHRDFLILTEKFRCFQHIKYFVPIFNEYFIDTPIILGREQKMKLERLDSHYDDQFNNFFIKNVLNFFHICFINITSFAFATNI